MFKKSLIHSNFLNDLNLKSIITLFRLKILIVLWLIKKELEYKWRKDVYRRIIKRSG